jgi:hypothetical protein
MGNNPSLLPYFEGRTRHQALQRNTRRRRWRGLKLIWIFLQCHAAALFDTPVFRIIIRAIASTLA